MKKKTNYVVPEMEVTAIHLEGVINTSVHDSSSPSMSVLTAEQEDWGDWE